MSNVLKQIQDLGGICWDRYIGITGESGIYLTGYLFLNSRLDECTVKQVNFNSTFPIEAGITGDFSGIKLYTDLNDNLYSQKIKSLDNGLVKNEFSINIKTSNNSGYLKIGDVANVNTGIFNEINLETSRRYSSLNIKNTNIDKISIDANTSHIPSSSLAKFRCIKFNPAESEETCIKILSTK
jgi:hypothetical protein